jgi:hypothetical protein
MEGITKGRKRNRILTKKQGQQLQQRRRSSSASSFLKCTTRSLVCFLALIVIAYLVILSSLINSKELSERTATTSEILIRKDSSSSSSSSQNDDHDDKNNIVIGKSNNDYGSGSGSDSGSDENIITIGVASTVTGCGSDPFIDGAAVLKHSLDIHSAKNNNKKNSKFKSKYIYDNIIFYHPNASECVIPLKNLGYILLERPTPINVDEIQGDSGLRERIVVTGCCGEVSTVMFVCLFFKLKVKITPHCVFFFLRFSIKFNMTRFTYTTVIDFFFIFAT